MTKIKEELMEIIQEGIALQEKYPDCKLLQRLATIEQELQEFLDQGIIQ